MQNIHKKMQNTLCSEDVKENSNTEKVQLNIFAMTARKDYSAIKDHLRPLRGHTRPNKAIKRPYKTKQGQTC